MPQHASGERFWKLGSLNNRYPQGTLQAIGACRNRCQIRSSIRSTATGSVRSYDLIVPHSSDAQFYQHLGRMLAAWREGRGLSQDALAVQMQCDQSYISRLEAGERQASVTFLLEWADVLGISFDDVAAALLELWRR